MSNLDKDIEILKEFKEKGYVSLMTKYNKDRIQTNTMVEIALENVLSELKQLIEASIDTVFSRNNFEVETLANTLYKLGIIDKEGTLYVYHKKIEKEVLKDD